LVKFLGSAALARECLFCADTPEAIVESCWKRAGPASIHAAMTDPMFRRVKTRQVTTHSNPGGLTSPNESTRGWKPASWRA
jgi:hypothetical protein